MDKLFNLTQMKYKAMALQVFSEMSESNKLVHFTAYHTSVVTIGEKNPRNQK